MIRFPIILREKENHIKLSKQFMNGLSEKALNSISESEIFKKIPNLKSTKTEIRKSEFIVMMLTMMGVAMERDVLIAAKIFDRLDHDGNGKWNHTLYCLLCTILYIVWLNYLIDINYQRYHLICLFYIMSCVICIYIDKLD